MRELEEEIERKTGIDLDNFLYECALRKPAITVYNGRRTEIFPKKELVQHNKEHIKNSDGILFVVYNTLLIGSSTEMHYCKETLKKKVITYIADDKKLENNPWLKHYSNIIITDRDELIRHLTEMPKTENRKNTLDCRIKQDF
ncbi:MAG: hypothetical protein WC713_02625 [Candidatus Methylomirabilota bacterium]